MKPEEIIVKSLEIRENLRLNTDFTENQIDYQLKPVPPFQIGNEIKLVIIGQDPTIKNTRTRHRILKTLNLDKNGALKNYISDICKGLDFSFENVYATNLFKYFYTIPPAQTIHVLNAHLQPNLELLKTEIALYPEAKIITLGEPVLQLLTSDKNLVKEYWNYDYKSKQSNGSYRVCRAEENKLGRDFYPFPHQPSIRKEFYKNHLSKYISFVKNR
jgi:uracil-DNA glycosylase